MKILPAALWTFSAAALAGASILNSVAEPTSAPAVVLTQDNQSVRNEIQHAIDRGLDWLAKHQEPAGYWQTADHPAVTGLAAMAFCGDPMDRYRGQDSGQLQKALSYLLKQARPDGSICITNLPTYNTAVSMMAFLASNDPKYDPVVRKARGFLIGTQHDFGEKGKLDTPFDGGFGYGLPSDKVSDMSNTLLALEAMHYSRRLVADQTAGQANDLNWEAAIHFLQSCQNLPSHNKEPWVSSAPKDLGGFVYHSGRSNAGGDTNTTTGRVTLRSYGSISYAGLLSYVYAKLSPDDPRVSAVIEWLKNNYTLDENPGMGSAGLFFYFHTMTKALTASGSSDVEMIKAGHPHWRQDLALKLINLQKPDGSWMNDNARWWEKEPALATSYMLLSLEMLWRGLGG